MTSREDPFPLVNLEAAGRMRFYAHDMELNFEQLYDTIMAGLNGETG